MTLNAPHKLSTEHRAHKKTESSRTMADASGPEAEPSDWSFLLKWNNYSGAEDNGDLASWEPEDELLQESGSSTADEDELTEAQTATTGSKIDDDEIVNIINASIAHYTSIWEPNSGVPKEDWIVYEPEKMWEDAESKGKRQQMISRYKAEVDWYTGGLDRLCEEIMEFPGSNSDAVRQQCKNLEMTVYNLELASWLLSIYSLSPESDSDGDIHDTERGGQSQLAPVDQSDQHAAAGIIDLGSPPASSIGDANEVSYVSPVAATAEEHTPTFLPLNLQDIHTANHGDEPEQASLATVRRWLWRDLIETQDRKRVVLKALHELHAADRENIRSRLKVVGKAKCRQEIKAYINMLSRDEPRIHGVLQRDFVKIQIIGRLFFSWWYCDDYSTKAPSRADLGELSDELSNSPLDLDVFYDFLCKIMDTTFSQEALQHPDRPSQAEIIEISDDED
ncbi:hypothetical protein IAQ61_011785 [Plenodomus lingam]|nr:hypothetical protein IAQ61_011785 [Plenodomus lingam]